MLTFGSARHIRRTGVSFLGGGCRIACLRTDACLLHSLRQQSAAAVVQQVSSVVVQQYSSAVAHDLACRTRKRGARIISFAGLVALP